MYERDKQSLDTYENPGLFSLVGESYFQGHLYESAARLLLEADNYNKDSKKPDKYTYMLGVALQESGENEKAADAIISLYQSSTRKVNTPPMPIGELPELKNKKRKTKRHLNTFKPHLKRAEAKPRKPTF